MLSIMNREALNRRVDQLKRDFCGHLQVEATLGAMTGLINTVVEDAYSQARTVLPHGRNGTALLSTGGYSRHQLHPYSDIDIILLFANPLREEDESFLKRLLHPLWDLGLYIGHHVLELNRYRFDPENLELATALLEARLVAGDSRLFHQFLQRDLRRLLTRRRKPFLRALVDRYEERQKRFSSTIYQLEPDVKEAPGGLRDLQVAHWLSRILYGVEPGQGLIELGLLSQGQWDELREAQRFLMQLRTYLHVLAGRNRNILSHESQEEMVKVLGYSADTPWMAVENLMKDYFLRAKVIHAFCESMVRRAFPPVRRHRRSLKKTWTTTVLRKGALAFPREAVIRENPLNVLKLFSRSVRYQVPVSEEALDQIRRNLLLIGDRLRASAEIRDHFLRLLRQRQGVYQALFLMHEIGLLGRIFPEFDRIRCHVTQDFFHKYTVDEHSLLTVKNLEDLYRERTRRSPRFGEILKGLERPDLLLFSLLFHDVGKAEAGNHCENSLAAVGRIGERIQLPQADLETVRFLVSGHLEMSNTFQRRDVTEESVIKRFAEFVGNQENLRLLCLVTYADITAVSPEALTPWKEDLLWQLYVETNAQLTRDFADERWHLNEDSGLMEEVSALVGEGPHSSRLQVFLDGFPRRYLRFTPREHIAEHYRLSEEIRSPTDIVSRLSRHRSTYRLSFMALDRPNLFAKLTGVLACYGMNIVRGQAFANSHGLILDLIEFEDRFQTFRLNRSEMDAFQKTLREVVLGRQDLTVLLKKRESSILFQSKSWGPIQTFVGFDDHASDRYTLMEIVTRDRFGLLYTIATTLARNDCNIDVALISTEGHKALDVFYLTQAGGKLTSLPQQALEESLHQALDGA